MSKYNHSRTQAILLLGRLPYQGCVPGAPADIFPADLERQVIEVVANGNRGDASLINGELVNANRWGTYWLSLEEM